MQWRKIKQGRGQGVWCVGRGRCCNFKYGGQNGLTENGTVEQRLQGVEVSHLDVWEGRSRQTQLMSVCLVCAKQSRETIQLSGGSRESRRQGQRGKEDCAEPP